MFPQCYSNGAPLLPLSQGERENNGTPRRCVPVVRRLCECPAIDPKRSWLQPLHSGLDNLPPKGRKRPTRQAPPWRLGPQVRPGSWFTQCEEEAKKKAHEKTLCMWPVFQSWWYCTPCEKPTAKQSCFGQVRSTKWLDKKYFYSHRKVRKWTRFPNR